MQADAFGDLAALTVLPITSTMLEAPLLRIQLELTGQNGFAKRSQNMIDKPQIPPRSKPGGIIGHLEGPAMLQVNQAFALLLRLA